nr:testis-expressed protein 48 [Kogia breviceps]
MTPITVNFQRGIWNSGPRTQGPIPFFHTAAHQNLASKIFCLCCKCCEEPNATDDSKIPSQTQELQSSKHGRYQAKTPCLASQDLILLIPLPAEIPSDFLHFSITASPNDHVELPLPGLQKDELHRQNLKQDNEVSHVILGKSLLHPEKRTSYFNSSEFEDVNSHVSKRGFHKRNLSRYSQDRWPYQPCLIGRP